jgi:hypothetical protein
LAKIAVTDRATVEATLAMACRSLDAFWVWDANFPGKFPEAIQRRRIAVSRPLLEAKNMGRRRERRRQDDRTADWIAMALALIRQSGER